MSIEQNQKIMQFANEVGVTCLAVEENLAEQFVPHIEIRNGVILFNVALASPADLLHECGHLALLPNSERVLFSGNLYAGFERYLSMDFKVDSLEYYIMQAADDCAVTAWTWAAGLHLGFTDEEIIHDDDYDNTGKTIRTQLALGQHQGISGLHYAGYTQKPKIQLQLLHPERNYFPKMAYWTADALLQTHVCA